MRLSEHELICAMCMFLHPEHVIMYGKLVLLKWYSHHDDHNGNDEKGNESHATVVPCNPKVVYHAVSTKTSQIFLPSYILYASLE